MSEGLLDHNEAAATWLYQHILMVEREMSAKRGSAGSSSVGYLRTTLEKRFPELWDPRGYL